jgi:predicted DNA-binding transcriptional regulator AlpA
LKDTAPKQRKRYYSGPQVLERYGGRSSMWLWRRVKYDPKFPRPILIGKRRFFDEDELDAFDEASRMEAPNAIAP